VKTPEQDFVDQCEHKNLSPVYDPGGCNYQRCLDCGGVRYKETYKGPDEPWGEWRSALWHTRKILKEKKGMTIYTEEKPPQRGRAKRAWELFNHLLTGKAIKEMYYSPSCDVGSTSKVRAWVAYYGTLFGYGTYGASSHEDFMEIEVSEVDRQHHLFITGPDAEENTKRMRKGPKA
jgi:hypothetical protein